MSLLPRRGPYAGRLAFDPDSGFHVSVDGRRVVTDDHGQTWRYATGDDVSHISRYERNVLIVQGTTDEDPHHQLPAPDDAHYDAAAPGFTRPTEDEDHVGHLNQRVVETVTRPRLIGRGIKLVKVLADEIERGNPKSTSHTEAWQ